MKPKLIDFIFHPLRSFSRKMHYYPNSISGVALNHARKGEIVYSYVVEDVKLKWIAGEEINTGSVFYSCYCGYVFLATNKALKPRWKWKKRCPHSTSLI